MSDFYGDMQAVASDVLRDFKQGTVQYIHVTPGTGPVDAPGSPTETVFQVDAAVRGVSFRYVDKTTVVATDLQATFAVKAGMAPSIGGFMVIGGVRHKIIQVMNKPAAGTVVAHVVIIRK